MRNSNPKTKLKNNLLKMVFPMVLLTLLCSVSAYSQNVIPYPQHFIKSEKYLSLNKKLKVKADPALKNEIKQLQLLLKADHQLQISKTKSSDAEINLQLDRKKLETLGQEGYELRSNEKGIFISAGSATGIFYGIQTLTQLIEDAPSGGQKQIKQVEIQDQPRFKWRSYMQDDARYFQGIQTTKKILDELARLKINTFHWHLTDDQGWRIPIKKYPDLIKIGSKRDSTENGGYWNSNIYDGKPHSGHYTIKEIKQIIAYAKERHIRVIPEIEMPGHASAAIASYPWLGVTKKQIQVGTDYNAKFDVFDIANPKTIEFLHDVLEEVIKIFPAEIIHIGGDEVRFDQWLASEHTQKYMKEHGLQSGADLQIAFTNKISKFLQDKGKRMMGWNDILGNNIHEYSPENNKITGELAKNTIIQFWKGDEKLVNEAINKGHEVVNSNHIFTYLDYDYKITPLEKAYHFEPMPSNLNESQKKQLIGIGAQLWGAWTPTAKQIYEQTFPRIAAYAEVGWTRPELKDYARFLKKLEILENNWQKRGIDFKIPQKQ